MKNAIRAAVVLDSMNQYADRLVTIEYTAPKFILAQLNTHRALSKNARSSRAVPSRVMIDEVRNNPVIPLNLGKNQPGMVAGEQLIADDYEAVISEWLLAAQDAANHAEWMMLRGAHKQHVNRVLESYAWTHGVITGTEWENFFDLRLADDAQPEIQVLAEAIQEAMRRSIPTILKHGEWHLPYIMQEDIDMAAEAEQFGQVPALVLLRKLSVARCARVSYRPFDGNASWEREFERYDGLLRDRHWSPFEHQATPDRRLDLGTWECEGTHANFVGWRQHRHIVTLKD